MNINFNTTIFALFGICFGANYWSSNMDDNFGETDLTGETEHCLQFFIAVVGHPSWRQSSKRCRWPSVNNAS